MNPKVNDIFAAINSVNRKAVKVTVSGTVTYPDWDAGKPSAQDDWRELDAVFPKK